MSQVGQCGAISKLWMRECRLGSSERPATSELIQQPHELASSTTSSGGARAAAEGGGYFFFAQFFSGVHVFSFFLESLATLEYSLHKNFHGPWRFQRLIGYWKRYGSVVFSQT